MQSPRYHEIDLLRFCAAIGVVLFHYTYLGHQSGALSIEFPEFNGIFRYGACGVTLFFTISGFVIPVSAWNRTPVEFLVSRIVRLYPAYWFGVTITTLCILAFSQGTFLVNGVQYVINLTMVQGVFNVPNIDEVYWTLLVEIHFYALVFLLLCLKQFRNLAWYCTGWLLLAELQFDTGAIWRPLASLLILEWAPYFAAGSLFFLVKQGTIPRRLAIIPLLAAFQLVVRMAVRSAGHDPVFVNAPAVPVLLGLTVFFFCIFSYISFNRRFSCTVPFFHRLGSLTYPVYLLHMINGYIIMNALAPHVHRFTALAAAITFVVLLSVFTVRFVERPLGGYLRSGLLLVVRHGAGLQGRLHGRLIKKV